MKTTLTALLLLVLSTSSALADYPKPPDDDPRPHKTERQRLEERWMYSGNAKVGLDFSWMGTSAYKPQSTRQFERLLREHGSTEELSTQAYELGVRVAHFPVLDAPAREVHFGARYSTARGDAPDGTTARVDFAELFLGYTWQLHPAWPGLDILHFRPQFYFPIEMQNGLAWAYVDDEYHSGLEIGVATGLGVRVYTLTRVVLDGLLRYRVAMGDPFERKKDSIGGKSYIRYANGKKLRADTSGFEPRFTLEILFPD